MSEKNKIVEYRGIRGLVAAMLKVDTEEELTYDAPFPVAGASELTRETETSSETKYYDNEPSIVIDGAGADTVNVNVSAVTYDVNAKITGQEYDDDTGMLIEGTAKPPYLAIGYITEDTDGTEYYVWRLKGKFTKPSETHKSKNNGTDADGQELTFTGVSPKKAFAANRNKRATAIVVEASKCPLTEKEFFASVQTPDDILEAKQNANASSGTDEQPAG